MRLEYMRVLPERVPELEAQGWHPAVSSSIHGGLSRAVVMVRERLSLTNLTPEQQYRLLALAAKGADMTPEQLRVELGLAPKEQS